MRDPKVVISRTFVVLSCVYSGLSFTYFSVNYFASVFFETSFGFPFLAIYMAIANMVLFAWATLGLQDKLFEWSGLVAPNDRTATVCRRLLLLSLANCVGNLFGLLMASRLVYWETTSINLSRSVIQVFSSIEMVFSLFICLYCLFGATGVASERVRRFWRDPFG
jgi:hypothetical protein